MSPPKGLSLSRLTKLLPSAAAAAAAAAASAAAGPSAGEEGVAVPSAATVAGREAEPVEEEPLPPAVVEEKVAGSGE